MSHFPASLIRNGFFPDPIFDPLNLDPNLEAESVNLGAGLMWWTPPSVIAEEPFRDKDWVLPVPYVEHIELKWTQRDAFYNGEQDPNPIFHWAGPSRYSGGGIIFSYGARLVYERVDMEGNALFDMQTIYDLPDYLYADATHVATVICEMMYAGLNAGIAGIGTLVEHTGYCTQMPYQWLDGSHRQSGFVHVSITCTMNSSGGHEAPDLPDYTGLVDTRDFFQSPSFICVASAQIDVTVYLREEDEEGDRNSVYFRVKLGEGLRSQSSNIKAARHWTITDETASFEDDKLELKWLVQFEPYDGVEGTFEASSTVYRTFGVGAEWWIKRDHENNQLVAGWQFSWSDPKETDISFASYYSNFMYEYDVSGAKVNQWWRVAELCNTVRKLTAIFKDDESAKFGGPLELEPTDGGAYVQTYTYEDKVYNDWGAPDPRYWETDEESHSLFEDDELPEDHPLSYKGAEDNKQIKNSFISVQRGWFLALSAIGKKPKHNAGYNYVKDYVNFPKDRDAEARAAADAGNQAAFREAIGRVACPMGSYSQFTFKHKIINGQMPKGSATLGDGLGDHRAKFSPENAGFQEHMKARKGASAEVVYEFELAKMAGSSGTISTKDLPEGYRKHLRKMLLAIASSKGFGAMAKKLQETEDLAYDFNIPLEACSYADAAGGLPMPFQQNFHLISLPIKIRVDEQGGNPTFRAADSGYYRKDRYTTPICRGFWAMWQLDGSSNAGTEKIEA